MFSTQKITLDNKNTLRYLFLIGISIVTLFKFSLVGNGFLSMQDERRYEKSGVALVCLSKGDAKGFLNAIFSTKGRPGETIIKCIPHAIQFYTANKLNLNLYETRNSYPLFIFNFIIYCLVLLVHYRFSKLMLKNELLALLSVLIFSCLSNSYLYLRHALPYDTSLLILYYTLYKVVQLAGSGALSIKSCFLLGLAAFAGYSVYPGYFPLVFVIGVLLFYQFNNNIRLNTRIKTAAAYACGFFCFFILFELLSHFGGSSFISASKGLSATIVQGSFEECFSFLYKYLWEAEGLGGKILMVWLSVCLIFFLFHIRRTKGDKILFVSGLFIMAYLSYAFVGFFLHRFVFYGRLLHMYYPFICIFVVSLFNWVRLKENYLIGIFIFISFVFVFSFSKSLSQYKSYSYPRDIGWKYINLYGKNAVHNMCEYRGGVSQIPASMQVKNFVSSSEIKYKHFYCIALVNCCYHNEFRNVQQNPVFYSKRDKILIETLFPYYLFKPYQFEGYGIEERKNIDSIRPLIKAYGYEFELPNK